MMRCGHCGTIVADGYRVCPACHARYERRFTGLGRLLLSIGVVVVLFFGLTLLGESTENNTHGGLGALIVVILGGIAAIVAAFSIRKTAWWRSS